MRRPGEPLGAHPHPHIASAATVPILFLLSSFSARRRATYDTFGYEHLRDGAPEGQSGEAVLVCPPTHVHRGSRAHPVTIHPTVSGMLLAASASDRCAVTGCPRRVAAYCALPIARSLLPGFSEGWTFHGDAMKVFNDFFGGENPFHDLFPKLDEHGMLPVSEPRTRKLQVRGQPSLLGRCSAALCGAATVHFSSGCIDCRT